MPAATRFRTRFSHLKDTQPPSVAATALETLTVEQVLYEIKMIDNPQWVLGQRRGHTWYNKDGEHLAEASEIKTIRIPAR